MSYIIWVIEQVPRYYFGVGETIYSLEVYRQKFSQCPLLACFVVSCIIRVTLPVKLIVDAIKCLPEPGFLGRLLLALGQKPFTWNSADQRTAIGPC